MRVGFIGMGLLGLPMAVAVASRGHRVRGYEIDPRRRNLDWYPVPERGRDGEPMATIAARSDFAFAGADEVVAESEIVFVAVQTPNVGTYDGCGPFPTGGADYDLQPLREAMATLAVALQRAPAADRVIAIASTMLPGTARRLSRELLPAKGILLAHTPAFAPIGRVITEILDPEFVVIGALHTRAGELLQAFYRTLSNAPQILTTAENAELVKTSYNGFVGMKIGFANALMELAHKVPGCDVDEVMRCLALGTRRLISPLYLRGGLGDGGSCHPKENAALAALANRIGLSYDPFSNNLASRDRQTEWLASVVEGEVRANGMPLWLLGTAFKANVTVEYGSPARLLLRALEERGLAPRVHDPLVPGRNDPLPDHAATFVLAMPHDALVGLAFPPGSVVIDPWRRIAPRPGVRVVAVGRGPDVGE